jgi:hypothetical protein
MTTPSRRDMMRPFEYLAMFSALIILATTRDLLFTVIGFGIIFILALMTLALLALAMKPDDAELSDLRDQEDDGGKGTHH